MTFSDFQKLSSMYSFDCRLVGSPMKMDIIMLDIIADNMQPCLTFNTTPK